MTYQDPNDPLRTTDPNRMPPRIIEDESSSMWGWIAGAVVVVLLAFALIGFLGRDDNVASNPTATSPSSTVGSAPSPATPPSTRPTSPLTQPSAPPAATPAPAPSESAPAK
jgi:hypothetical protein